MDDLLNLSPKSCYIIIAVIAANFTLSSYSHVYRLPYSPNPPLARVLENGLRDEPSVIELDFPLSCIIYGN